MKTFQEIGRKPAPSVERALTPSQVDAFIAVLPAIAAFAALLPAVGAAGATGGACDARGARRAVPLGNTGTTTVGDAQ